MSFCTRWTSALLVLLVETAIAADIPKQKAPTMADVLAASKPGDWRALDPENALYVELASGRVVIELAPNFAPRHVANVKALARERYYDGLAIVRCQDNYVVQLADGDVYAPEVGFSGGFPVARDPKTRKVWLVHCYGMVGAGRDAPADSGGGTELYVVIGQAPRHLDRNVTLLGRVVQGIDLLSALPRGTGALGFYEKPQQRVPIKSVRVAADLSATERTALEVINTDTPIFQELIESRRNRSEDWFHVKAGHIELCNVPIPVRPVSAQPARQ